MSKHKIKFRDYKHYPPELMKAAHFRDEFDDLPDGAFFAMAQERKVYEDLIKLGEWEHEHTEKTI